MTKSPNKREKSPGNIQSELPKELVQQNEETDDIVDGQRTAGITGQSTNSNEVHTKTASQPYYVSSKQSLPAETESRDDITEDAVKQQSVNVRAETESEDFINAANDISRKNTNHALDNPQNKEILCQLASASDCESIVKSQSQIEEGDVADADEEQRVTDVSKIGNNDNNFPSSESPGKQSSSFPVRIKVKSEFSSKFDTPAGSIEHLADGFLDDLLEDADEIGEAIKHIPENNQNQTTVKIETIPDSFFDDILVDQAKERVEDAFNEELEMKYSRELEQLQELTRLQDSEKNTKLRKEKKHEKHKKSKKRSRKRSHSSEKETSTSQTNDSISHKICPTLLANPSTYGKLYETNSLRSATPSCSLTPSTNFQVINDDQSSDDNSVSNFMAFKRFKLEKPTVAEETEENFQNLTPQERAFLRVTEALESFKKYSQNQVGGEFIFTSTVRKLPNSTFGNGKFYEHRSPLHSVNNVSFKFNSHAKSFDMHEWGLEALPPKITHICRVLGYDADSLFNKLKTVKLPPKLSKLKADAHKNAEINMIDNGPSFLNNVSTQTDDDNVIELKNGPEVQSCDAAIQVIPPTANKAAQTSQENLDDLPITSIMRRFNENQLMALHDFAELLSEPYSSDAMNIYRIRQRMVDIYKGAQVQAVSSAAEIEPPPPPPMRNYRGGGGNCPNLTPVIENVYRADGSYYATNNRRPIMQKPGGYKYSPHIPPADPRRVRNSASSSTFATKSFGRGRTGR